MKCRLLFALLAVSLFAFTLTASARDTVVPAGTLLQCTLNEPNLSSASVDVGDPVLCHLRGISVFGQRLAIASSSMSRPCAMPVVPT